MTAPDWRVFDPMRDASIIARVDPRRLVIMIVESDDPADVPRFMVHDCVRMDPEDLWHRYKRMVEGRYDRLWLARYGHTLSAVKASL